MLTPAARTTVSGPAFAARCKLRDPPLVYTCVLLHCAAVYHIKEDGWVKIGSFDVNDLHYAVSAHPKNRSVEAS